MNDNMPTHFRFLVTPILDNEHKVLEDRVITTFLRIKENGEHKLLSLPSNSSVMINVTHYSFLLISEEEYETYVEFGMFPEKDSDDFAIKRLAQR